MVARRMPIPRCRAEAATIPSTFRRISGNDTIIGGSGNDTVDFADRSFSDVTKIDVDASTSTYTLHFSDNQTVAVSGVEDLHFTDQDVTSAETLTRPLETAFVKAPLRWGFCFCDLKTA